MASPPLSPSPAAGLPAAHAPPPTTMTILISGGGTNLQALIDACSSGLLPSTRIIRVISNRKTAYGLARAAAADIPTSYLNLLAHSYHRKGEADRAVVAAARRRYDADLARLVLADGPDVVVCAGWMHILEPSFLDPLAAAEVPVINLHPALPGRYDGAGAIQRAFGDWEEGKLEGGRTGVMVHYVISEVDRGEPILVREIEIKEGDTLETLTERIHEIEYEVIVKGTGLATTRLWQERSAKQSSTQ